MKAQHPRSSQAVKPIQNPWYEAVVIERQVVRGCEILSPSLLLACRSAGSAKNSNRARDVAALFCSAVLPGRVLRPVWAWKRQSD